MGGGLKKLLSYLSFSGRANRARFWLTAIAIWGILVLGSVAIVVASALTPLFSILFLPVLLAAFVAAIANSARRLHDRGKSAWWLLLFVGLPVVLSLPAEAARNGAPEGAAMLGALCAFLSLPFSIWGLVEMGFLRGVTGPNRFGDDPLSPAAEVFA
jgi:uncharacterized membrane protein YhaH (DUF805 family)